MIARIHKDFDINCLKPMYGWAHLDFDEVEVLLWKELNKKDIEKFIGREFEESSDYPKTFAIVEDHVFFLGDYLAKTKGGDWFSISPLLFSIAFNEVRK